METIIYIAAWLAITFYSIVNLRAIDRRYMSAFLRQERRLDQHHRRNMTLIGTLCDIALKPNVPPREAAQAQLEAIRDGRGIWGKIIDE